MWKPLRQNPLGVGGVVVGILGILSSYYFYQLSVSARQPVLAFDPHRTVLIEAENVRETDIALTRPDGSLVREDVNSLRLFLWNEGKLAIRPSHVLMPIGVSFADPSVEILDVRLLSTSRREIVRPRASVRPTQDSGPTVEFRFDILDYQDGMSYQVLFAGPTDAEVLVNGAVEGAERVVSNAEMANGFWWQFVRNGIVSLARIGLFVLVLVVAFEGPGYVKRIRQRSAAPANTSEKVKYVASSILLFLAYSVTALVVSLLVIAWLVVPAVDRASSAREREASTVLDQVPRSIMP